MWLFDIFRRRSKPMPRPRADAVLYEVGGTWGSRIEWTDNAAGESLRRVVGWKSPIPTKGDVLICAMKSGKTGVWVFMGIEYCMDPSDMFFADVCPLGYVGEVGFDLPPRPRHPLALVA